MPRGTLMYGPIPPSGWPRSSNSELRQYAANEWHADHLFLISEVEKHASEVKRVDKERKREGGGSRALNFLISLRDRSKGSANWANWK
jgi:hypothetical protein